jgi:regulatory subunit for Cdc7p protein kinase
VREYPNGKGSDGKWPQLRPGSAGKCPFLEDTKARGHVENVRPQPALDKQAAVGLARTRGTTVPEVQNREQGSPARRQRRALTEDNQYTRRAANAAEPTAFAKPLDPPKVIPAKRSATVDSVPPMFNSTQAKMRTTPRYAGGEPVASGVQPSNITSAIRSHIVSSISSTAPGPGARAGTTKEFQQLKRKVLERSGPSGNSVPSSYQNELRAALNAERGPPPRAAKRKAQESLAGIKEDMTRSEEEKANRNLAIIQRKSVVVKEPKPGYCENCREKFNDFDEVS